MNITGQNNIGELVAENYQAAAVFQSYGIDFCCQGNRTISEASEKKGLDTTTVVNDLNAALTQRTGNTPDFQSWPLDLLADYVEKKHHRYVTEKSPVIKQYLDKICKVHGAHHPELFKIKEEFFASADELAGHMRKEESVLFPMVRKLAEAKLLNQAPAEPALRSVQGPIQVMMAEHNVEGERFREIAGLSAQYTPPADACNTYKVAFALLKEFEADLHLHIHLENNILFPGAIKLEQAV